MLGALLAEFEGRGAIGLAGAFALTTPGLGAVSMRNGSRRSVESTLVIVFIIAAVF